MILLVGQAAAVGYEDLPHHQKESPYAPRYNPNVWRGERVGDSLQDSSGSSVIDSDGKSVGHGFQTPDGGGGKQGPRGSQSGIGHEEYPR